jgi:hypothetical protein
MEKKKRTVLASIGRRVKQDEQTRYVPLYWGTSVQIKLPYDLSGAAVFFWVSCFGLRANQSAPACQFCTCLVGVRT